MANTDAEVPWEMVSRVMSHKLMTLVYAGQAAKHPKHMLGCGIQACWWMGLCTCGEKGARAAWVVVMKSTGCRQLRSTSLQVRFF